MSYIENFLDIQGPIFDMYMAKSTQLAENATQTEVLKITPPTPENINALNKPNMILGKPETFNASANTRLLQQDTDVLGTVYLRIAA